MTSNDVLIKYSENQTELIYLWFTNSCDNTRVENIYPSGSRGRSDLTDLTCEGWTGWVLQASYKALLHYFSPLCLFKSIITFWFDFVWGWFDFSPFCVSKYLLTVATLVAFIRTLYKAQTAVASVPLQKHNINHIGLILSEHYIILSEHYKILSEHYIRRGQQDGRSRCHSEGGEYDQTHPGTDKLENIIFI